MSKQIRPLTSFKKLNPETFEFIWAFEEETTGNNNYSEKQKQNNFYWNYAYLNANINTSEKEGKEIYPGIKQPNIFFWKDEILKNNKITVTEMGRLLLTGWYYDNEHFTLELCTNVYNAYLQKIEEGENFNDLEFSKIVENIRQNITYYLNNEHEYKTYLLKHFLVKK